ncbi:MAG: hypothetical protein ACJAVK_000095 [Akkermansiaceae bacterium]|jgi:hypothetical protein
MPTFLSPEIILALAKVTALLLVILALAPLLRNQLLTPDRRPFQSAHHSRHLPITSGSHSF